MFYYVVIGITILLYEIYYVFYYVVTCLPNNLYIRPNEDSDKVQAVSINTRPSIFTKDFFHISKNGGFPLKYRVYQVKIRWGLTH